MKTTDDVIAFLRETIARADRGELPASYGIFARAYTRVTLEVIARVAAGRFEDPAWLSAFDVRFASLYRDALETPKAARVGPWKVAFDDADRETTAVLRQLILGINAHMSYDLCVVLLGGFVEPDRVAARKRDFDAMNSVMAIAIDPIQAIIEERYGDWLRSSDGFAVGFDELVTYDTFVQWRTRAWDDAMAIAAGKLTLLDVERRVRIRGSFFRLIPV